MWTQAWRDDIWSEISRPWDIIIVGGGITGAGILREASRAGLRVLLLEKGDFASGTSSRSSKLVHGGLRYLRNGQFRTTVSSVHERERLLREGRGLVTPLGFLFASFEGDSTPGWAFGLGLAFYDVLGLRWGHKYYDPSRIQKLSPHLSTRGLSGGYRYFDAQTDDARLVIRVIRESVRNGSVALNYAHVENLLLRRNGRVCGVTVQDLSPAGAGRSAELKAKVVVNASGTCADIFRRQVGGSSRLRYLRGSHLVFPASLFPLARAVSFFHPVDQRPIFALPWEGVTLFGTTDVEHNAAPAVEPSISPAEVDYLMVGLSYAFPSLQLKQEDVQATFSGVRCVVDSGKSNPSKESREHVLWAERGLLTVSGGKLTTFRVMAQDALRLVRKELPGRPRFRSTRVLDEPTFPSKLEGLEPIDRARITGRYGGESRSLIESAASGELTPIGGGVHTRSLWAELRWAARCEGVIYLQDLLLRRVRLGILLPNGALPWMDRIQAIVQNELGWDDERWERELSDYLRLWCAHYSLPAANQ